MRVKELLKQKGMTAKELATKMGVSEGALSKSLSGNPTLDKLLEIATALNVDVWELFTASTTKSEFMALVKNGGDFYQATTIQELENIVEHIKG